jgi:hypothetical protein
MWFGFTINDRATTIGAPWLTLDTFPALSGWDFRQMAFVSGRWMRGHALHRPIFFSVESVSRCSRARGASTDV